MSASEWMSLVACAGILPLVVLSLMHRGRSPMALPVALLSFDLFMWNFATWAYRYSREPAWLLLDGSFSAFMPALTLHAVVVFVGRSRSFRWLLVLGYILFTPISAWAVIIVASEGAEYWLAEGRWSLTLLGLWVPLLVVEVVLLVRHLRRATTHGEQMRTRWFLAAVVVGGTVGSSDLYDQLLHIPGMGHVGALLSAVLVTMTALRWRLFGRELATRVALYSLVLATVGVLSYLLVFRALQANNALLVIGTASVTLILFAAIRDVLSSAATQRERLRRLAALGRFSAQMSHDLKNPLSSLKGAVQFLTEERAQGRSVDAQGEFFALMDEQIDRIDGIVERYQRMSAVEPVLATVQLNELVEKALASAASSVDTRDSFEIRTDLATSLPPCRADRDLLLNALANVIRNGIEAMEDGGTLTVRTAVGEVAAHVPSALIIVEDSGCGMDARELERAAEDFYTTKAQGSGLGLAFARRVVEAHDGELRLSSAPLRGTTVSLRLPTAGPTEKTDTASGQVAASRQRTQWLEPPRGG